MSDEYEFPENLPAPSEPEPEPIIPDVPDEFRSDDPIGDAISDTVEPPPPPQDDDAD